MTSRCDTVVEALREHARLRPDTTALVFTRGASEPETVTYGELDHRARSFGAALRAALPPDALVLLPMRSDAASVAALCACLYAGLPCAPVPLPARNGSIRHLRAVAGASGCAAAIVPPDAAHLARALPGLAILSESAGGGAGPLPPDPSGADVALVQYTSGSAADPKGVLLTHANLAANLDMLRAAFRVGPDDSYASWLPLFHDMGLAMVLMPLHFGVPGHLMPPLSFLRDPALWLRLVDRCGATITGAPNFAYEACARRVGDVDLGKLDLGRLRVAFCGAEPVRLATMRRFARRFASAGFRASALYPCYGMAEAVTFVSGGHLFARDGIDAEWDDAAPVTCGAPAPGTRVAIVDPLTLAPQRDGAVGEVWVAGPQVGAGYLGRPDATRSSFGARLDAYPGCAFLRTGDLGTMDRGALTITGRIKDVIIHRGANIHAGDVEATVAACHPGFGNVGAAFAWTVKDAEHVVLVHEEARGPQPLPRKEMRVAALEAVALHHGVRLHDLVLVRAGSIPKTSSGKVRRDACRTLYAEGGLRTTEPA